MERDIDLVIPMVFPQDKEWQRDYIRCNGSGTPVMKHVRFRSWGTEALLIECCRKYMPWLRTIHILLARESQKEGLSLTLPKEGGNNSHPSPYKLPSPFGEGPGVRLVFHRDFVPAKYLPCFASPCFEMFLHRIPGLSEHFIYANDDMFPLSPLRPEDFFRGLSPKREGSPLSPLAPSTPSESHLPSPILLPCLRFSEDPFPAHPNLFQRKCMAQQNMIGAPFGQRLTRTLLKSGHSFAPILKSACEEVWRRHGRDITRHLSPLKRTDHSYNHYIYLLYQYFSGLTISHAPRHQYVSSGTPARRLPEIIRDPKAGIVCLNDNETIDDWQRRAAIVRKEITEKLNTNS